MTENQDFDREINLKGITYATAGLVLIVIVSAALMWWMLRGFQKYDEKRDLRPTPIEAANPQQPPPAPRLQVAPGFAGALEKSDREDMQAERENEDKTLSQPGWVDQGQGTVRVPIETAMQMVVRRGLGPLSAAPAVIPPPAAPHPQPLSHPLPAPGRGAPPPTQGSKTSAFSPPLPVGGRGWERGPGGEGLMTERRQP